MGRRFAMGCGRASPAGRRCAGAVRLLPAANASRPTHRLSLFQRLPFSAEVAAAPSSNLAALAAANGIPVPPPASLSLPLLPRPC